MNDIELSSYVNFFLHYTGFMSHQNPVLFMDRETYPIQIYMLIVLFDTHINQSTSEVFQIFLHKMRMLRKYQIFWYESKCNILLNILRSKFFLVNKSNSYYTFLLPYTYMLQVHILCGHI